jgi:hypothetical protein
MRFPAVIILLFAWHSVLSQDTLSLKEDTLPSTYNRYYIFADTLQKFSDSLSVVYRDTIMAYGLKVQSKPYFDAFFSKWLAYVNFAKDGYPDGNSVLVAPNSSSTLLRATLAHKGGNIVYNAGTQLNFSNNIANVISKSDVTSNTTFFASCSVMPSKTRVIQYDPFRARHNDLDKRILLDNFVASVRKKYQTGYSADSLKYRQLFDSVRHVVDSLQFAPRAEGDSPTLAQLNSLVPVQMLTDYYASLQKLRSYGFNEEPGYESANMDTKIKSIEDSLKQVIDSLELSNDAIKNFRFGWFSGSFAYTRNDYTTYNGNAPFPKRINDVYFDSLAFNVGYNFLFERTTTNQESPGRYFLDKAYLRSVYFTINYNIARDVNYAHITPVSLVTSQNISNPNTTGPVDTIYQLQSQTKGINITNKPEIDGLSHTFSAKLVTVLANSSFMGFDLSFSASYGKLIQPVYSTQVGMLFRFSDSQTQKTKVNFELFLQLNDFGDSQHSGLSTWQRKVVGINVSIPFSKLFF